MPGPDLSSWAQPATPKALDLTAFANPPRSLLDRFKQNAVDGLNRSSLATQARNLDPSGDGKVSAGELFAMPQLVPGGLLDRAAQAFGAAPAGPLPVNHAVLNERARRETFDATSAADPFYQAPGGLLGRTAAGGVTLLGQLAGAATDPLNFAAPGKTIWQRAALAAPVNAGADVLTQLGDMGQGVQDRYRPTQTLTAAALGPVLSVGGDLAAPAARAAGRGLARGFNAAREAMPDLSSFGRPPPVEIGRDPLTGGIEINLNESTNPDFLRGREPATDPQGPDLSGFARDAADAPPFDMPQGAAGPAATAPAVPTGPAPRDFTAEALDVIRSGSSVRLEQGPSLIEYLSRNGGLRDDGGELSALDADRWHRDRPFRNKLVREGGLSIEEAASRARDAGFFNDLAPASMDGESNMQIGGDVLLDAVRRELAGEARYSRDADPQTADLAQHVADLDELLSVAGIDPKQGTPEEIRAAIDAFLRSPDPQRTFAARPAQPGSWRDVTPGQSFARGDDPGARFLAEDVDAPKAGPLAERIAAGERPTFEATFGPSGRATMVTQRSLADLLPADRVGPLHHETDLKGATGILNRTLQGYRRHDRIFVSPERDLALGQKGRGVVLEFDPSQVNGFQPRSLANDATGAVFGGQAELVITKTLRPAVRAITTSTAQQLEKLKATPWIASRFDFDAAQPVGKGFRVERKAAAPSRLAGREEQPDLAAIHARMSERVKLADGEADQGLIPGVAPVSSSARGLEAEALRRASARGAAPPPAGGLFDEAARAQGDMFDAPPGRLAAIDLSSYGEPVAPSRGAGLRAAPKPGAVPRAPDAKPRQIESTSFLAARLKQSLGLTHRQGRMTLKKALGEYDPSSGIIRTKVVHEIDVLAHEGGHALEFKPGHPTVKATLKAFEKELSPLAYPGADPSHLREEGFAEWFRWYVTNPTKAASEAPGFTPAFEAALAKDAPQVLRDLGAIRDAYQDLLSSASVDVARSAIVWPAKEGMTSDIAKAVKLQGVMATVRDLGDDAYTALFDRLNPIKVAVRRLLKVAEENSGKRFDLKAAADPYKLSRLAVEPYTAGQMDVLHGVTPYRGIDPEGASLSQAIGKALGDDWSNDRLEEFGTYLVARRMVQEWKRRDAGELKREPHSLPAAVWKTVISDLEGANPTWAEAARSVHEWTQNLWRKQYESGLIGATTYDAGRKMPDYVPLQRDLSDKMRGVAGVRGDAQFAGGVKEFKGSTRDIINPLRSLMERAQRVSAIIARNDVFKALDDLGQRAGAGGGAIVERIPASEAAAVHVNVIEALEKAAKDAGLHEADYTDLLDEAAKMLDGNEIIPLFQSGVINTKGEPILFVWKNGRREAIRLADGKFGRDLYTILAGLQEDPRSLVVDLLAKPTQILRAGVWDPLESTCRHASLSIL